MHLLTVDCDFNLFLEARMFEGGMFRDTANVDSIISGTGSEFKGIDCIPGSLSQPLGHLVRILWNNA